MKIINWQIQINRALQLNLKQMLNSRTMSFPSLNTPSLFSTPFSTGSFPLMGSSRHMSQNNRQTINEVKKIEKRNVGIKHENTGVLKCNNMYEQVGWFKKQNLFQSILKIIIIFFISLTLFAIDLFGYQMWLGTTFATTLLVIHQSRIFQRKILRIWVFFGLVFSAFVIVNHLFITFLNFISSKKAELLYYNYLTLLPSLLITITLFSLYLTQPLTLPSTLSRTTRFPSCIKQYFHNLKNHLINIKKSRYYLLQVYSLSFLSLYILVSLIKSEKISANAKSYLCLFHPFVFITQFVTFAVVVVIRHFFFYWVQETVFWAVSGWMYESCNHYTGIPLVLELLGVVSTSQINSEVQKSGLTASFNIFSLADSRRSNGLTRSQHQNIYRHSLAWLLNFLNWRSPTLNNKLDQYCSAATRVSQPKTWTSYWQILLQFMNQELQKCVGKTFEYSKSVQQVGLSFQKAEKSQKPLGWIDYAIYLGIAEKKQWLLSRKATQVARYFNIFQLIIEVVNMNGFDQLSVDGEIEDIRKKLEQLQVIVNRICDNVSVSEIMEDRLKLVSFKCRHILNKMPK